MNSWDVIDTIEDNAFIASASHLLLGIPHLETQIMSATGGSLGYISFTHGGPWVPRCKNAGSTVVWEQGRFWLTVGMTKS